jgi:Holliday junction resolvase RusA-like endonuclease
MRFVTIKLNPMGKPRMTQRDKWDKRDCVLRYYEFKDELIRQYEKHKINLNDGVLRVRFVLPFPKSYKIKKRDLLRGKPHQEKPDIDNLVKAVLDSVLKDDKAVWKCVAEKVWGDTGLIIFAIDE